MGLTAIVCALLLLWLIPNEVWAVLLYIGLVLLVGFVGWWAFIFWIVS